MKVSIFSGGKITVFLTSEDIVSIGIPIEKMASNDPEIKLIMKALYKAASEKVGLFIEPASLFVVALPTDSGGVLHFTPQKSKLKANMKSPVFVYEFYDGTALLDAIEMLFNDEKTRNLESVVYASDDSFFLEICPQIKEESLLRAKEFSDNFYMISKKELRKQRTKLAEGNAIFFLGEKIKAL